MVRDHSSTGNSVVVEHSIEIPPSAHGHRVQVSSSPKKHVVTVERCDLLKIPTRAEEDEQLITARLSALNLYARPNGLPSTSPCNRTSTPDVFVTAEPSPAHFAHPRLTPGPVGATQEVDDDTSIDGTPVDEDYIPVHLRWVGGCRDRASYAVPRDIQALYPADSTDRRGWKEQKYYVVVRGYETGIFFDYWARIRPFGFVPGALSKAFNNYSSAQAFWKKEEAGGNVRVLYRSN